MRVSMGDISALDAILNALINYVRPEVEDFRSAIAQFQIASLNILQLGLSTAGRSETNMLGEFGSLAELDTSCSVKSG